MKKMLVAALFVVPLLVRAQTADTPKKNTVNPMSPSPLIIVDGIRKSNMNTKTVGPELKPENIEKVEVIKGKDAARLYGNEGKNGVVLITTKKSRTRKAELPH